MFKITKFKACLIILCTLLTTIFIFRQPILETALKWYVHSYCRSCFNAELKTGEIVFSNNTWIINHPTLQTEKSLQAGAWTLKAEQLLIAPDWQFWKRRIDLEITLLKPKLNLTPAEAFPSSFDIRSTTPFAAILFFKSQGTFHLEDGQITIDTFDHHPSEPHQASQTVDLQIKAEWGSHFNANLVASFDHSRDKNHTPAHAKNRITASLTSQDFHKFTAQVDLNEVDCKALSRVVTPFSPSWKNWKILDGIISGDLTFTRLKEGLLSTEGQATLKDFAFTNPHLHLQGKIPHSRLSFHPNPLLEIFADASFSLHRKKDNSIFWSIAEVEGFLLLHNGLHIALKTDLGTLAKTVPFLVNKGIAHILPREPVSIDALLVQESSHTSVKGAISLDSHKVPFEFDLERADKSSSIKNGHFEAQALSLKKYVAPLLFKNKEIYLQGSADLSGTFDHQKLDLQYVLHDFELDHPLFTLKAPNIGSFQAHQTDPHPPKTASHQLNLVTGAQEGFIPLKNAILIEKKSGLCGSDISTNLFIKDDFWHCDALEAFCQGIYLAGDMQIFPRKTAENNLEGYDIKIHTHTASGKVAQFQQLLRLCNQLPFLVQLPLEGDLTLRQEGGDLDLFINSHVPEITLSKARLEGSLSEGSIDCPNAHIALQDLSLDFAYNQAAEMLEFSNIQGALLLGKSDHIEEYSFNGDRVHFLNYAQGLAEFDIWVSDKKRDLIRLAGQTKLWEGKANFIEFILDHKLSHFVDTHPSAFQLVLKDWSEVNFLHLQLDFQLNTLLSDLQRFSKTGLLFLSRHALQGLNALKTVQGNFNVDFQYDNESSFLNYKASATNFAWGKRKFNKCLLNGKKKDNQWQIDQLQLDELSIAANLTQLKDSWKTDFLGIRYGKSFLIGLEGDISSHMDFDGKINLFEINLSELQELPFSQKILNECSLKGLLRGNGEIHFAVSDQLPKYHLEARLKTNAHAFELKGVHFQDFENVDLHYSSQQGLSLKNIQSSIKNPLDGSLKASLQLDNIDYDFIDHEILLNRLQFHIPAQNITWINNLVHQNFPNILTPSLKTLTDSIKPSYQNDPSNAVLEGVFSLALSPRKHVLSLSLSELVCKLFNRNCKIKNFILKNDLLEFKVQADCTLDQSQFPLTMRSKSWELNSGELVIGENYPSLVIAWQKLADQRISIESIQGSLKGISANLRASQNKQISNDVVSLQGSVCIDPQQVSSLPLSDDIQNLLAKWNVKGKYTLIGDWQFNQKSSDQIAFLGTLTGQTCSFTVGPKKFHAEKLSTEVAYTDEKVQLQNFEIIDPIASIKATSIDLQKNSANFWSIAIPSLKMLQFSPALIWPELANSNLVVRDFELNDFKGNLSNLQSYQGEGRLSFINPTAKNSLVDLFSLPLAVVSEVSSYNLDIASLGPTSGKILYHLNDGKIYFDRFKDFYSHDRLSKFYISSSNDPSTLDWNGNLNLHIKMKQYNLVFKLAELFTMHVGGNLNAPTYTLHKKSHVKNKASTPL